MGQLIKDSLPWTYPPVPVPGVPHPDAPLLTVTPVPPAPSRIPSCCHPSPDPIPGLIPCSYPVFSVWLPFPYSQSRIPFPVPVLVFPFAYFYFYIPSSVSTFPFPVPFPYSSSRISVPLFPSPIPVLSSYSSSHILSSVAVSVFPLPFPYSVPVPTPVFPVLFPISVPYFQTHSRSRPLPPDAAAIAPARPSPHVTGETPRCSRPPITARAPPGISIAPPPSGRAPRRCHRPRALFAAQPLPVLPDKAVLGGRALLAPSQCSQCRSQCRAGRGRAALQPPQS